MIIPIFIACDTFGYYDLQCVNHLNQHSFAAVILVCVQTDILALVGYCHGDYLTAVTLLSQLLLAGRLDSDQSKVLVYNPVFFSRGQIIASFHLEKNTLCCKDISLWTGDVNK